MILSPGPLPGTPEVSKINYLGLSYLCVTVSRPVGLTARQHFSGICPESADRLVVFVYLIACRNLRVRWSKNHYLLEEQVVPTQSRSSILLVSRSCSVFPLREPTGIGHRNLIPVPIPSTTKSVVTGIIYRNLR